MKRHILSKSTFIRGIQCEKSLYLHKKRPFLRDKLSAAQLAKFRRGTDMGILARELFPGGIDMTPKSPSQYQKKAMETRQAIADPQINVIYEAVFQYDDVLVMLDILVRDGDCWQAYEVKSSRAISKTYLTDAALQYYVINGSGLPLCDFSLIYVNSRYILEDKPDLQKLFVTESVLQQCRDRQDEMQAAAKRLKAVLQLNSSPAIDPGLHCYKPYPCDFIGHCWKNMPKDNIFRLTSFEPEKIESLRTQNILSASAVNPELAEKQAQQNQLKSLQTNHLTFEQDVLKSFFSDLKQKRPIWVKAVIHHPALPELRHTRPYQPLPLAMAFLDESQGELVQTQFCSSQPAAFVASFAEKLINICGTNTILVTDDQAGLIDFINSSEKLLEPEIYHKLSAVTENILGLKQIFEASYAFHPATNNDFDLATWHKALLNDEVNLKEEAWLIKDLLSLAEKPAQKYSLTAHLQTYIKTIKRLFEHLRQFAGENKF